MSRGCSPPTFRAATSPDKSVPSGGDAYTLKFVLHVWNDEKSTAILKNLRKAIGRDAKILVMEGVIDPATGEGAPGKFMDINMLAMSGGRERTAEEFAALYRASGFELEKVVPVHPMLSILEGRPA